MKNIFSIAFCLLMVTAIINGYSQTRKEKRQSAKLEQVEKTRLAIEKMLKVDSAFFFAVKSGGQSASVPFKGSQSSNGYFFKIENSKIECYLPYFGVVHAATLTGGGIDFTSNNYTYSLSERKGAAGWLLDIKAKEENGAVYDMNFTISPGGNSSLTINPTGRQVVTFTGTVESLD
ncbi:MAG: DUF4251 domain-containing protein [Rikenellaceae bacterium]